MTIFSAEQIFSDDQAITATAASTNILDTGLPGTPVGGQAALQKDIGKGTPVPILIQVTEDFDNLTTLQFELEVDGDVAFGSPVVVNDQTIALADLVAGRQLFMQYLPNGVDERYFRLNYTVVGSAPSAGKITAGITFGNQTNV